MNMDQPITVTRGLLQRCLDAAENDFDCADHSETLRETKLPHEDDTLEEFLAIAEAAEDGYMTAQIKLILDLMAALETPQ